MKSNIGKLIDEKGYKKKYIAEKMEVTPTQLSNWINNRNYIPIDKAFKLADLLNCKVDDLYSYKGEKEGS
ncbi:helix-turn-helix domain-containing protein [Metabacillus halosaccharovorans]|uniref:helix-turn-helix domain-containing protein n=1 Tax=Metabacillus halosaccharovorans TaxID=930124 RepID=UPI0034CFE460